MTLFVNKGDVPLTPVQLENRAQKYIKRSWPDQAREKSIRTKKNAFDAFMDTFSSNHDINIANNTFNWQLQEYRKATQRLARYIVADGRAEVYEDQPTGAYDDEGNEVMQSVLVQTAIDPVDAKVNQTTYDDMGENPVTTEIENWLITVDVAERTAAQAVVDATPQEVIDAS